jgi:hypothetical protein
MEEYGEQSQKGKNAEEEVEGDDSCRRTRKQKHF